MTKSVFGGTQTRIVSLLQATQKRELLIAFSYFIRQANHLTTISLHSFEAQ